MEQQIRYNLYKKIVTAIQKDCLSLFVMEDVIISSLQELKSRRVIADYDTKCTTSLNKGFIPMIKRLTGKLYNNETITIAITIKMPPKEGYLIYSQKHKFEALFGVSHNNQTLLHIL